MFWFGFPDVSAPIQVSYPNGVVFPDFRWSTCCCTVMYNMFTTWRPGIYSPWKWHLHWGPNIRKNQPKHGYIRKQLNNVTIHESFNLFIVFKICFIFVYDHHVNVVRLRRIPWESLAVRSISHYGQVQSGSWVFHKSRTFDRRSVCTYFFALYPWSPGRGGVGSMNHISTRLQPTKQFHRILGFTAMKLTFKKFKFWLALSFCHVFRNGSQVGFCFVIPDYTHAYFWMTINHDVW